MRQIAIAMHTYVSTTNIFPAGYYSDVLVAVRDVAPKPYAWVSGDDGGPGWSGHSMILPWLEQSSLYNGINFYLTVNDEANSTSIRTALSCFRCPSDGQSITLIDVPDVRPDGGVLCRMASANFIMSAGTIRPTCRMCRDLVDGVFGRNHSFGPADISDGLSQTFGGGERAWRWSAATVYGVTPFSKIMDNSQPGKFALGPAYVLGTTFKEGFNIETEKLDDALRESNTFAESFGSLHTSGSNFWFCDGSVRFIPQSTDIRILWDYATRAGGPKGAKIHW